MLAAAACAACVAAPAAGAAASFQSRCESNAAGTAAVVEAVDDGWSVNNSLSYKALTALKGAGRGHVLGLTRAESHTAIGLRGKLLQDLRGGQECIAPTVLVKLSYAPIVIYIASEFAPGSCAYEEILAHEMRHLKVYLAHLPKVKATVRAALDRRFAGGAERVKPLYAPAGQARAQLDEEMQRRWMPFIKHAMAQVETLQAPIDSPQEYARLSKVCEGDVQFQ